MSSSSSNSTASPPPPDNNPPPSSPPPSSDQKSPPPPDNNPPPSSPPPSSDQKSPPPPSSDNGGKSSLPPPSNNSPPQTNQSPPPPSSDIGDDSSPPPSSDDNNGNSSLSPPPPPSSPPPPSPSSDNDNNSNNNSPPPPPPFKNHVPPPPPLSSSFNPPSSGALSPPHTHAPASENSSPSPSSGLSQDTIQKIAIGASVSVALLLIMFVVSCIFAAKSKKKRKEDSMQYYGEPPKGGGYYNNSGQHPSWANQQAGDHVVKLPPSPNNMRSPSSGGGWPAQPPPPPPMMSSGEMSSNFSGGLRQPPLPPPSPNLALGFNKSTFTYDELALATDNFAQANLLGQGGFGYVHKGVFPNGKEVAVKSLKTGSGQGEREFQAEVEIISRVHHRHLVSLVGYCIAGGQRMLVYEFVPNNTLEYHLHGADRPVMDFQFRLRIAMGSAKGLAYLHEDCHPRIIHRDIKAANILVDYNFEAMVADFGLAKLSSDNYTHVSTRVMGTFGYLAPEYAASGKLTEKSDVFSYGVMLLELITGKRPVDSTNMMEDSLVDWARPLMASALEDGYFDELVDSRLENNYNPQEMARMVACAAASIRHSGRRRPKMSQIVRALEGDVSLEDLNDTTRPGQTSNFGSSGSSDYDTAAYNVDMKKFKKTAMSSQEFSGEFGASSGEMSTPGKPPKHF